MDLLSTVIKVAIAGFIAGGYIDWIFKTCS